MAEKYKNEEWLRGQYKTKGLSATTIALGEHVSETTITYYLKKFGIYEKGRRGDRNVKTLSNTFVKVKCSGCDEITLKSLKEVRRTDRVSKDEMYCSRGCADNAHSKRMAADNNPNYEGKWHGPEPSTILSAEQRREFTLRQIQRHRDAGTFDEFMAPIHLGHKRFFSTEEGKRKRREIGIKGMLAASSGKRTSIEIAMSEELTRRGIEHTEQFNLDGVFVPDFMLTEHNIIIECDGDYWHSLPENVVRDKRKNAYYRMKGITYFRFWEREINADVEACVDIILTEINAKETTY